MDNNTGKAKSNAQKWIRRITNVAKTLVPDIIEDFIDDQKETKLAEFIRESMPVIDAVQQGCACLKDGCDPNTPSSCVAQTAKAADHVGSALATLITTGLHRRSLAKAAALVDEGGATDNLNKPCISIGELGIVKKTDHQAGSRLTELDHAE
jgi:hypothetical protein